MSALSDKIAGWFFKGSYTGEPLDGSVWAYDSTENVWEIRQNPRVLFAATASATVANTVTETTIIGTGTGSLTLPADFFIVSRSIRMTVRGVYGTQAAPVGLTIRIKLGSTVIMTTGSQLPGGALTDRYFETNGIITCRTTGATGTVFGQGEFPHNTSATDWVSWEMLNTAATTINTTISQVVDVTVQWAAGVAAADTITGSVVILEALN